MLSKSDIEKKANDILERKRFIKLCVDVNICPDCGAELQDFGEDYNIEMGCNKCSGTHMVRKYLLFGPLISQRKIKYW